jgi:hypothetical protein
MPEKKKGATAQKTSKATPKAKACAAPRPTRTKAADTAPKIGRPTLYSEALADEICRRLANGESLSKICRSAGMPVFSTILGWALNPEHAFYDRYARARDIGYRHLAEELLEISDDSKGDLAQGEDGRKSVDHEHIARARLRVDTRKWMLSKMLPKLYGEKITSELVGQDGGPVQVNVQNGINDFMAKIDAIARRQQELKAMEEAEAEQEKERR